MKYSISLIALAALAACGDTQPADEVGEDSALVEPVPERVAEPAPTPTDDGTLGSDRVVQGSWTGKTERGVPMALFGEPNTEAAFSVRCEGDTLVFARSALVPAAGASMRIMADGTTHRLIAKAEEDPLPRVTARMPAADPFALTLARNTDPIAVAVGDGGETYPMPSSTILRGVIADCLPG